MKVYNFLMKTAVLSGQGFYEMSASLDISPDYLYKILEGIEPINKQIADKIKQEYHLSETACNELDNLISEQEEVLL